ncbi:dicarboxylate/amino acid:cation symporter [Treponema phagedenis]|uniref:dicarboxylate/amino acid:cation symporter n=1 Tax=Treponema phagedenis TaxID=162 RepID=UPI001CA46117|nr:dicarboxylate/amino acid:cation symporter [Treponema phagedenis]
MMKKFGLLPRLILAIVLGIVIGFVAPLPVVRTLATFNGLFGNLLSFVIPLIIVGFVAPGIADLGSGAGKSLAITAGLAYGSTITFGTLAYIAGSIFLPIFTRGGSMHVFEQTDAVTPFFNSPMPPIFGVTTALILSFILGVGIASLGEKRDALKNMVHEFADIVTKLIKIIVIPLLPVHICGIFATMAHEGTVARVMSVFAKVFILIIIMHWLTIFIQYTLASLIGGGNPFSKIRVLIPAYLTAIGTQSSAATIPVTLAQTIKMGVNKGVAEFVIPLCATIHLSGSTITLLTCSMTIMFLNGMDTSFTAIFPFILMLGVTMVAAPGVPGGAVMAAIGIMESMLGFDKSMIALMIALYLAQDSFGTACNISGDGAIACIVNKINGYKLTPGQKTELVK